MCSYETKKLCIGMQSVVYRLSGATTDFVAALMPYVKKFEFDDD